MVASAGMLQECNHLGILPVRVGPRLRFEPAVVEAKGDFAKDAAVQIDAMGLVLRRCQNELTETKEPGVEVQGSFFEVLLHFDQLAFEIKRSAFDCCELIGRLETVESEEGLL